jgi:hypothetical protein
LSLTEFLSRKLRNEQPRNREQDSSSRLRDALFGDTPLPLLLASVKVDALRSEPWATFTEAERARTSGESGTAITLLRTVLAMPNLDSRMYLEAWQALRTLGVSPPPEQAKDLLGVVVEYGLPGGVDLVAAWPDHCARYWNFSGGGIAWERADGPVTGRIDELLGLGAEILKTIDLWNGERPAPPANGYARINLLTPSGLHFGFGTHSQVDNNPMAGPVLKAALRLMQALMKAKAEQSS